MSLNYYIGDPDKRSVTRDTLPPAPSKPKGVANHYVASNGLVAAANVSISLGQPLLLTGEPGCGKTQFAESLADELGLPLLSFITKSSSVARDLLYSYDAVGHFRNKNVDESSDAHRFIRLAGLGKAIIKSNPTQPFFDSSMPPERSVLLIDEIDKAPRDFPNDLLYELDRRSFSIPEFNETIYEANANYAPIVVITSNSEKHLPDAFMRRCCYYNISFPDSKEELQKIVLLHLRNRITEESILLQSALGYFLDARNAGLTKNPGIAELIQFITALLNQKADPETNLTDQKNKALGALGVLFKNESDLKRGTQLLGISD